MQLANLSGTFPVPQAAGTRTFSAGVSQDVSRHLDTQVESLFTSILLKTLRQTLEGDGLFPGDKSDALGALFDQFMGIELAKGGGLGMGRVMSSYLQAAESADGVEATHG